MNGTQKLDSNGEPIPTYTNDDVLELSRVWTGFDQQPARGNIENPGGDNSYNHIDPLWVQPTWRDSFPKLALHGRHIGDSYPACWSLPKLHFLRKGARYHYLGEDPTPKLQTDHGNTKNFDYFTPVRGESQLHGAICGEQGSTAASCKSMLDSVVTINSNLECHGIECDVETVRVIKIDRG